MLKVVGPIPATAYIPLVMVLFSDAFYAGTALIALAGRLPSSVLAELLDIHVQTARKWAAYSQPDWAAYLAERIGTATTTRRNTDLAQ